MMKFSIKIFLSCMFFISFSCEDLVDGDGDINVNPNNPASTGYQNILISAEVGQMILQNGESARRAGIFSGTHTGIDRQHEGYTSYTVTTTDFDDLWDDVDSLAGVMTDLIKLQARVAILEKTVEFTRRDGM